MSQFVKNKTELNTYYKFNHDVEISTIDNFLITAEEDFIVPVLGETFFNEIVTKYEGTPTATEQKLIENIQRTVVEIGAWMSVDSFNVSFGSRGLVVTNDKQSGTAPASEARTEKLKESLKRQGLRSVDRMIKYLELNKATFTTWAASAAYAEGKQYFINTPAEFQKHRDINQSRFLFIKMLPIMQQIEEQSIMNVICESLFNEIKTQIQEDNVSSENENLLKKIRPAVANITFSKAVLPLGLRVDGFGVSMFNNSSSGAYASRSVPDTILITKMADDAHTDGKYWLSELKKYLQINADNYPLYKNSDCYTDTTSETYQGSGVIKITGGAIT